MLILFIIIAYCLSFYGFHYRVCLPNIPKIGYKISGEQQFGEHSRSILKAYMIVFGCLHYQLNS